MPPAALGQPGLQRLQRARRRACCGQAHGQLQGPLEQVTACVDRAKRRGQAQRCGLGLLRGVQFVQREQVAIREDFLKI